MSVWNCCCKINYITDGALPAKLHGIYQFVVDNSGSCLTAVKGICLDAAALNHGICGLSEGCQIIISGLQAIDIQCQIVFVQTGFRSVLSVATIRDARRTDLSGSGTLGKVTVDTGRAGI